MSSHTAKAGLNPLQSPTLNAPSGSFSPDPSTVRFERADGMDDLDCAKAKAILKQLKPISNKLREENPTAALYTIQKLVGAGGFGFVFQASMQENGDKRQVAIKFQQDHKRSHDEQKIHHLASIEGHANIVSYIAGYYLEKYQITVSQYIEGKNLREYLDETRENPRMLERRYLLNDILKGTGYLHEIGVYHYDLKCSNIMLELRDATAVCGSRYIAKITDFGLSVTHSLGLSEVQGVGTAPYRAPELITQPEDILKRSLGKADIWSIGIITIAMMGCQYPWFEASMAVEAYKNFIDSPRIHSLRTRGFRLCVQLPFLLNYPTVRELIAMALHPEPSRRASATGMRYVIQSQTFIQEWDTMKQVEPLTPTIRVHKASKNPFPPRQIQSEQPPLKKLKYDVTSSRRKQGIRAY